MIGDTIEIGDLHLKTAALLFEEINKNQKLNSKQNKIAIGIAGESGCGKTITAFALQKFLEEKGIHSAVLQQDDYFILPPKTNHENRLKNIENVGLQEVNFEAIEKNFKDFKNNCSAITKPLVHYKENKISTEIIDLKKVNVLIIEGTYILNLKGLDFTVFIDRNYKDTYENRMLRNRDVQSDFVENVLEIEHQIIKTFKSKADVILDVNYQILPKN